ncbi:MAG: type II toxin-antitoxin system RelE/ParE family toxin [Oligoflexia bacterium]|nr:type II toxin-antitoxin system RelE/ParE family toxin [Oligoflexia bacterium]
MKVVVLEAVKKILKKETKEIKEDISYLLKLLEEGIKLTMPHVRYLGNYGPRLFELRVKDKQGQFRVIYFTKSGDAIYLLHAFRKKTQETPQKEIATAIKRLQEIINEE